MISPATNEHCADREHWCDDKAEPNHARNRRQHDRQTRHEAFDDVVGIFHLRIKTIIIIKI